MSVPLRSGDGRSYGTVCCFSFRPDRTLTTRDLGVLRLCADVVDAVLATERSAALDRVTKRKRVAALIEKEAIEMAFQPIYATTDRLLVAFEALARFDPDAGLGPDAWFADAAEVGLGEQLEGLAARTAIAAARELAPSIKLSINLSPSVLMSPRIAEMLADAPLDRLIIELTEHASVPSYEDLRRVLDPLRARGTALAIDDVGAGHSTLRHVLDLAPEFIKLDMALIRGIDGHSARRALAEALTRYAQQIGCEVVAEGVETLAEYAVLREIGVTRVQGFLTGRPMPIREAARLPVSAGLQAGTDAGRG